MFYALSLRPRRNPIIIIWFTWNRCLQVSHISECILTGSNQRIIQCYTDLQNKILQVIVYRTLRDQLCADKGRFETQTQNGNQTTKG